MLDGRVKTIPKYMQVFFMIGKKNTKRCQKKFSSLDLIVVNFYPFQKIVMGKENSKKL